MTYRIMSAKARTASRVLATLTATVALAAVGASQSVAQQARTGDAAAASARRPAPASRPARPSPRSNSAPALSSSSRLRSSRPRRRRAMQPQLIFSPWVKLCNKDADPKAKRICVTVKDGRVESGLLVVSVAIIEMDGEQKKLLRMSLPYGVALAARHPPDRRSGRSRRPRRS